MSDNTNFRAVLFNNTRAGERQPNITGHISVPVNMIDELVEILQNQRTHNEQASGMTIKTVRIPLSFWSAPAKSAPMAYSGQSSFYTPEPMSEAPTAEPVVDKTPTLEPQEF